MNDHNEVELVNLNGPLDLGPSPKIDLAAEETPKTTEALAGSSTANPNPHAEAGRKGARRIHQLIQEGKLYEQEHGFKRGRQRLRQLIEEGKLYEEEHGLHQRKKRDPRQNSEQL